jgi:hypothetical protein
MLKHPYEFNRLVRGERQPYEPNWHLVKQAVAHCREERIELFHAYRKLKDACDADVNEKKLRAALADLLDAACDLRYVAGNVLWALGVPLDDAVAMEYLVHLANMQKLVNCTSCDGMEAESDADACLECGGSGLKANMDEAGKVLKPYDWRPPNWAGLLDTAVQVQGRTIRQMMGLA